MLLVLLFILSLLECGRSQAILSTLSARKNSELSIMELIIRINGEVSETFRVDAFVPQSFQQFEFTREPEDIVEIVVSETTTPFPGRYYIDTSSGNSVFSSQAANFFPINQCLTDELCNFRIVASGTVSPGLIEMSF